MAGPGKGVLKRFCPPKSSNSHRVPQPLKSSSNRDVPKGYKSSSSRSRDIPQPQRLSSNLDVPPPHISASTHEGPRPQKSSSSHDVPKPHKSSKSHNIPPPHESSSSRDVPMENQGLEEDHQEEDQEIDSPQIEIGTSDPNLEENIGSASYGTSVTRKESRVLSETRKRHLNKGQLIFEVDECAGRIIIGEDSQQFITKGGCLVRDHAKFDGTTWRNHSELLKKDIINKCMENSNYDPNCRLMVRAIHTQLANQHRNRVCRLHVYYKKFATKEDATRHPPKGIVDTDWVKLCEKFASEEFQKISTKNKKNRSMNEVPPAVGTVSIARIVDKKRREGEQVSAIEQYKIGHFSAKKNRMVNEKATEIWNELLSEEAASSCSPTEICLKKLHRIPGYVKGRAASTKQILATENLRMELELEKEKSKALEEEIKKIKEDQVQFQEEQKQMKNKMDHMMAQLSKISTLGSQN